MKLSQISQKLFEEMFRLKEEQAQRVVTVQILLKALYAFRGKENEYYTNLFHIYFEKRLRISPKTISAALEKANRQEVKPFKNMIYFYDNKDNAYVESSEDLDCIFSENDLQLQSYFLVDEEMQSVMDFIEEFVIENNRDEVYPDYFIIALFETGNETFRSFLKELSVNFSEAMNFFDKKKIFSYEIVPYELSSFVTYKNLEFFEKECDIVGREDVLNDIYRVMMKSSKRNVILYGSAGVGKTAIAEKFTYQIANGKCPKRFRGFKVFEMSIKDFIISCDNPNMANDKMNFLLEFLTNKGQDVILLIDEIQTILGKGGFFDAKKMDISTTLKPILTKGEIRIIGITTQSDYDSGFLKEPSLNRRFEGIKAKEPKMNEVFDMIKPRIKIMEKSKGITISDELIENAIWYAACFEFHKSNPDKSIDAIDRAMANAEISNRDYVIRNDILNVFEIFFNKWRKMPNDMKKSTAYHEAGHYVLNKLTNPDKRNILAVSIMPVEEEYNGVNVYEYDDEVSVSGNRDYYIKSIATLLAGRIAEKMVSGEINVGASSDLYKATAIAEEMVTEYGMSSKKSYQNRVLSVDMIGYEENSEKIDDEIEEIIDEAYKFAEKILTDNRDILDAIAISLLKNGIMRKAELESVWNDVLKKRKIPNSYNSSKQAGKSLQIRNDVKGFLKKVSKIGGLRIKIEKR